MSNFRVGQKVVCVDDAESGEQYPGVIVFSGLDGLRNGVVYTIRSVFIDPFFNEPVVRLEEIYRRPLASYKGKQYEGGFAPRRFRPVAERKTDIAIFKAMLEDKKARVRA